ncbi:MAG: hypothetical protein ACTSP1_17710 [Candidatus Freyarchaeota archaeon]
MPQERVPLKRDDAHEEQKNTQNPQRNNQLIDIVTPLIRRKSKKEATPPKPTGSRNPYPTRQDQKSRKNHWKAKNLQTARTTPHTRGGHLLQRKSGEGKKFAKII